MTAPANIINHIVLVLDASSSMIGTAATQLVKVADNQIAYLAQRSKELDQETRVTVYQFGSDQFYEASYGRSQFRRPPAKIDCLVYDKDVLRVPSIAKVYHAWGNTPLIDATVLALDDLAMTPEKYGEHSFLVYVLTDGKENDSQLPAEALSHKINNLPDHWTLAAFVPDQTGVFEAKRQGFPAANIAVWDATTVGGVEEVGGTIRAATENFMQGRARGERGSRNLFSMAAPKLSEVKRKLTPLHPGQYRLYNVGSEAARIDEFIESETRRAYVRGEGYYQLVKREKVQASKKIAIMGPRGVFVGEAARDLLGLPDHEVTVAAEDHAEYDIYVQSTSNNRKLVPGQKLLVLS
jgi:hypothetical protein